MTGKKLTVEDAVDAVNKFNGNKNKAAKYLKISRFALYRLLKKSNDPFLDIASKEVGFSPDKVSNYWIKTPEGSFHVRNDTKIDYNDLREAFINDAKDYAPSYKNFKQVVKSDDKNLLIIDIADAHFGKLSLTNEVGAEYNLDIAARRMKDGVNSLLTKAIAHGIDRIVFVLGNDILHTDTLDRKTTGGTAQDTDSMWWDAYDVAKRTYVSCIETLAEVAPVHLVYNPSNHDRQSGFMLADSIASWFRNHPNVILNNSSLSPMHRKYIVYGNNLLGFTHFDSGKEKDLSNLMQFEAREQWGKTKFGYWYIHHYHSKSKKQFGKNNSVLEKDHIGITTIHSAIDKDPSNNIAVEVVRSQSEADGWHFRHGYVNHAAVECFIHNIHDGQVARFTQFV